jgi:hypothetical protein
VCTPQVLEREIARAVASPDSGSASRDLPGQLYDGWLQGPLPFELRVLDAVLREATSPSAAAQKRPAAPKRPTRRARTCMCTTPVLRRALSPTT